MTARQVAIGAKFELEEGESWTADSGVFLMRTARSRTKPRSTRRAG